MILAFKFVDNLVPLDVRSDFTFLEVSNPKQVFLQSCQLIETF